MDKSVLKPGWRKVKFGEVVQLSKARCADPLAEGVERFVGLEHLQPGDLRIRSWGKVADGTTFTSVFKPGQVLFGKRRAYQRKVAVADFSGVCSGDIYVLESQDTNVLLPDLLPFICQTDAFFEHAVGTSAGSLSPRTNWSSLADFEFALPPIGEQHKALTLLDAAVEQSNSLENAVKALLHVKAAMVKEFIASASQVYPIIALVDGCVRITDGTHQPPKFTDDGIPFFLVKTISSNFIDWSSTKFVSKETYDDLTKCVQPKRGDILYTAVGATYGVALLVDFDTPFIFQRHIAHIIPNPSILIGRYIEEFLNSTAGKRQSDQCAVGSAQPTVTLKSLSHFKLPCPPIDVQATFVSSVEELSKSLISLQKRLQSANSLRSVAMSEVFQ